MKHNEIISSIEDRLAHNNMDRLILTNHEFEGLMPGEADILCINELFDYAYAIEVNAYAIEVKTHDTIHNWEKVKYQLYKDACYIQDTHDISPDRIHTFYAYSCGDSYEIELVNKIKQDYGKYDDPLKDSD